MVYHMAFFPAGNIITDWPVSYFCSSPQPQSGCSSYSTWKSKDSPFFPETPDLSQSEGLCWLGSIYTCKQPWPCVMSPHPKCLHLMEKKREKNQNSFERLRLWCRHGASAWDHFYLSPTALLFIYFHLYVAETKLQWLILAHYSHTGFGECALCFKGECKRCATALVVKKKKKLSVI